MTNGQIAQLQELSKCWLKPVDKKWLRFLTFQWDGEYFALTKWDTWDKQLLRRLWHEYRHQIAAMRKNRVK
jgi:hypothetical protein